MSIGKNVVGGKLDHRKREYETEKAIVKGTQKGLSDFTKPKIEIGDIAQFKMTGDVGTVTTVRENGLTIEFPPKYHHTYHKPELEVQHHPKISGKTEDFILIRKKSK